MVCGSSHERERYHLADMWCLRREVATDARNQWPIRLGMDDELSPLKYVVETAILGIIGSYD